jgi:hypothetical protein
LERRFRIQPEREVNELYALHWMAMVPLAFFSL